MDIDKSLWSSFIYLLFTLLTFIFTLNSEFKLFHLRLIAYIKLLTK